MMFGRNAVIRYVVEIGVAAYNFSSEDRLVGLSSGLRLSLS
jgi:hypothetical protein